MSRDGYSKRGVPDNWTAPPKETRVAAHQAHRQEIDRGGRPLTLEERLNVATMDGSLPQVDLHGRFADDVEVEIDALLAQNSGEIVRIVYGIGTGTIERKVMEYLNRLSRGKGAKIDAIKKDDDRASCVVKVK